MAATLTVGVNQVGPSTSEGVIRGHRLLIDRPEAKGGADRGPMGGELMLAAIGGCFMSNLLAAVRAREAGVDNVKVRVVGTVDGNPARFVGVHLAVSADCDDRDLLEKLVVVAERGCLCANTVKDGLELTVAID